jgi:branched-chain amino acid transport system substrate-binding protein
VRTQNMSRKGLRLRSAAVVMASAFVLVMAGCAATDTPPESTITPPAGEPIIVGFEVDSSGPQASFTGPAIAAAKAAIEIINDEGGVLGRPLTIIECDDASDPTKVGACLQKMASEGAQFFLEFTNVPTVIQSKTTVQELGIPTIAPTNASATVQNPPDNEFIYTVGPPAAAWAPVYCEAFQAAGIEKLALLMDDSASIATFTPPLLEAMSCVDVVDTEVASATATDISAEVARLDVDNSDAIFISSASAGFELLAHNSISKQFPDALRVDVATLCNLPASWKLAEPGALVGSICMGSISAGNPESQRVEELLQGKLGSDFKLDLFTAEAWDGVNLMRLAIEAAGSTDPADLNTAIQGLSGVTSSFGFDGFTLSYAADKHNAPDGSCGLVLLEYGPTNTEQQPWDVYQPDC